MKPGLLLGQNIYALYGGSHDSEEMRRLRSGLVEHIVSETDGRTLENWLIPIPDGEGEVSIASISLDITEATRGERELRAKLEVIEKQQEMIRELSTPIIEVWDGVLTLPIVRLVDSTRTAELMQNLLEAIARTRAHFAVLDLTGVSVVDTGTASHLIGLIQAIRLLGAEGILTGIHPSIAGTFVGLGVDLSHVAVFATLRDALEHCINAQRTLGLGRAGGDTG
jgi:rsbT co-antagonist protein RsbR